MMSIRILFIFVFSTLVGLGVTCADESSAAQSPHDPFASVEIYNLDNGVTVVLAPSPQALLTKVRVDVGVGFRAESKETFGVSHLLEHVLFRDKDLQDDMSYLQLIEEEGGSSNGVTEEIKTSYFASIPAKKTHWLFQQISQLILNPEITAEYVEKEKKTIELERGRPSPIVEALGFNPMERLFPDYLKKPSFWEREFHVNFEFPYSLSHEQLNTRRLTVEMVQRHYDNYYYPANMTVYVAGNFNRTGIKKLIDETWAKLEKKEGLPAPQFGKPQPERRPHIRVITTNQTPFIHIGTVVADMTVEDQEVLASYIDYLSHRLMKEIRNKRAQAYTVSNDSRLFHNYGYVGISFETPKEFYEENYSLAQSYIENEARKGALSKNQIEAAKDLYLNKFRLWGSGADSMMWLASHSHNSKKVFGNTRSPQEILSNMSDEEYNQRLKKHFRHDRRYIDLERPPLLFHYDLMIYGILLLAGVFAFFRFRLTSPFSHKEIRWVRKLRYPPLKLVEAAALAIAVFLFFHVEFIIFELSYYYLPLGRETPLSQVIYVTLYCFFVIACIQLVISLVPKKLMVVGDKLYIKSLSYYSKKIPLKEIKAVRTIYCWDPQLVLKYFWAIKWRFFFADPFPWKKGLLLQLKDGRAYFLSISNPQAAQTELQDLLRELTNSLSLQKDCP